MTNFEERIRFADVFESMIHGQRLTKFVAVDRGLVDGDFTIEIHGFVTESAILFIVGVCIGIGLYLDHLAQGD